MNAADPVIHAVKRDRGNANSGDTIMSTERTDGESTTPFGRATPWEERKPGLPSDMECGVCGTLIEDGDACHQLRRGLNSKAEFAPLENGRSLVVCLDCAPGDR